MILKFQTSKSGWMYVDNIRNVNARDAKQVSENCGPAIPSLYYRYDYAEDEKNRVMPTGKVLSFLDKDCSQVVMEIESPEIFLLSDTGRTIERII